MCYWPSNTEHTYVHAYTHIYILHRGKGCSSFILNLSLSLPPPQAPLTQLVVWRPNSSCPTWLRQCGSWGFACSLWLTSPPPTKVSITLLWYCSIMLTCWSWHSNQQDESQIGHKKISILCRCLWFVSIVVVRSGTQPSASKEWQSHLGKVFETLWPTLTKDYQNIWSVAKGSVSEACSSYSS